MIHYTRKNTDVISNLKDTPLNGRSLDVNRPRETVEPPAAIREKIDVVYHSVINAKANKDLPVMMR